MKAVVESMSSNYLVLSYSLKCIGRFFKSLFISGKKREKKRPYFFIKLLFLNICCRTLKKKLEQYNSRKDRFLKQTGERNLRNYKLRAGGNSPERQTAKCKFLKRQPSEKTNSWRDKLLKRKSLEEKNSWREKLLKRQTPEKTTSWKDKLLKRQTIEETNFEETNSWRDKFLKRQTLEETNSWRYKLLKRQTL